MDNASGHLVILAGAGVTAALLSAYMLAAGRSDPAAPDAVVVTLPQRAVPAHQAALRRRVGPMSDPAALTRTLQLELKRVGCYDGDISGVWSAPSRTAMKAFTKSVNAALPVDTPDQVLLALVQSHKGQACGTGCPAGEIEGADGRCLPGAMAHKAAERPPPAPAAMDATPRPAVKAVPHPVLVTRKPAPPSPPSAPAAPRIVAVEPPPAPAPPPQALAPVAPLPQPAHRPHKVRRAWPVPAMGVYKRRIRRYVRRAPSKPAAVARSLLRSLARAAQGPW